MLAPHIARFEIDATPPLGHPLCGGWIKPASAVDGPLSLRGVVLLGSGLPIVLAALDWTGVLNESHRLWTEALADAAHTAPDRVALHCVHQHNAPFVDREGNALLKAAGSPVLLYDEAFLTGLIARSAAAVRESLAGALPFTHVRVGAATVREVASNRRVIGPDGRIKFTRYSATTDPDSRAAPEGVIDPALRSVTFAAADRPLSRLYYYTTHPMSYYGDGRVTPDFVGLARNRRDRDEPGVTHLYFTGAAGNITAGKYNTGTPADRAALTDRLHAAMADADREADGQGRRLGAFEWTTAPMTFAPREDLDPDALRQVVADPKAKAVDRNVAAMTCGWLSRLEAKRPIVLGRLDLGAVNVLHLPAETFVEYQLAAQQVAPGVPLATAAYGDGGPWYVPLRRSFDEGGYEPSRAFVSRDTEPAYARTIAGLLRAGRM